ncbi:MAG: RlmE family RNA methyltransferase [Desulfovibrio sp.]|jgi:23S rRNA (uridine2552-2'-O)-methyltransferase|nr:RlmE family RNA methyltransferase [Desulfovibrio sp.]
MKEYRDYYFKKAKRENYPARSIYKLLDMDRRLRLFKKGMRVLDLGASPGSWTLGAAQKVGPEGFVLAVDLKDTDTAFPAWVLFRREDVFAPSLEFTALLEERGPFQIVLSDMAPSTTGHKGTDQARSFALCEQALRVALNCLEKEGALILKFFMGPDGEELSAALRQNFTRVKTLKPAGSRPESKEIFYAALGFKG